MERYICLHGHFYQPPRENPWLEAVELQDSSFPYHDWNSRITAECYAPNAAARILDSDDRIVDIVSNYSKISFNFGPSLLSWMEREEPEVYRTILEADRLSQENFSGHGSAIAQVYNHMIMPLSNQRDRYTQVIWGIRDFQKRFGRDPEGMWLPETAVDIETLEILAEFQVRFTILAPSQARRTRKITGKKWQDVKGGKIDPSMPYLCRLPSGRTINLFFYDAPIAHDLAFGDLLQNGEIFARRLAGVFSEQADSPQLVHIATDGETFGHHRANGDMALAYCLHSIESNELLRTTIYGEYLEKHPTTHEVQILKNTSWSCCHGIERWRSDCGCHTGGRDDWSQAWRAPLRRAMNWLRDRLGPLYEIEMSPLLHDPWKARDDYIDVILDRSAENTERFFSRHAQRELFPQDKVKILKLLEMQRHAMLMYTSCGWFFDEISGIETTQVMQYAGRAIQLAKEVNGVNLEPAYLKNLERAPSNVKNFENGRRIYEMFIKPASLDLVRVGAHYAVSSLFEEYPQSAQIYCYTADAQEYHRMERGRMKLAIGKAKVQSEITWNESDVSFAVLHLGDHNLNGGVREFMGNEAFARMSEEIKEAFKKSDIPEVIRLTDKHFSTNNYSLFHLFKDEQRKILNQILESTLGEIEVSFRQIYEHYSSITHFLREVRMPLPEALTHTVGFVLNTELQKTLEKEPLDLERLRLLTAEVEKFSVAVDETVLSFVAGQKINNLMEQLARTPEDIPLLQTIAGSLELLSPLPVNLRLWKAQNIYFSICKEHCPEMRTRAEKENETARLWMKHFLQLGHCLQVKPQQP